MKLYIILFLLFSCGNSKDILDKTQYKFKVKKTIKIQLDSLTKTPMVSPQVVGNEIVFFNPQNNTLQFYDITQKNIKLSRKIQYNFEGKNGVSGISKFLIHNEDSIFLLSSYAYKVFLMDKNAEIIQTYKIIHNKIDNNTSLPDPLPYYNPLIFLNNRLYINARPDRNSMTKEYYNAKTLCIELDLKSKKFNYMYGFSDLYRKNIYTIAHSSCTRVYSPIHNKFVYSFFADHNVYLTDYKNTNEPYIAAYSQLREIPSLPKYIVDNEENNRKGNEMPTFFDLRYDKYQKIFYRTFITPKKGNIKGKVVIILLDKNLQKIGEIEKGKILLNSFFMPEGMYIQKLNNKNENELVYDLVELVKE